MAKLGARAVLVEGFRSVVDNLRGHSVVLDLPDSSGGGDTGATALELAVMALAGCLSTVFSVACRNRGIPIERFEVRISAEKPDKEQTVTSCRVLAVVSSPASRDRIERAWEGTLRSCPVGELFSRAGVGLDFHLEIEGDGNQ